MQINANSMMAHTNWMASNSSNVANVNSSNYQATDTALNETASGSIEATFSKGDNATDLSKEMTEQIPIERGFEANARVIQTEEQMIGSLIDLSI